MAHGSERRGSQGGTLLLLYRARWKVNIYYVHPRLNKGEAARAGLSSRGVVGKPDTWNWSSRPAQLRFRVQSNITPRLR